jgi:hypothetical protein
VPILWPCAPSASATGVLRAEWYHDTGLQHLARVDGDNKIDFDWDGSQPAGMNDTFSVRWSGQISPRYSEQYRFVITRDDVARLWVGGQLLFTTTGTTSTRARPPATRLCCRPTTSTT